MAVDAAFDELRVAGIVLLVWIAISAGMAHPATSRISTNWQVAIERILVDSDLDWGQDIIACRWSAPRVGTHGLSVHRRRYQIGPAQLGHAGAYRRSPDGWR